MDPKWTKLRIIFVWIDDSEDICISYTARQRLEQEVSQVKQEYRERQADMELNTSQNGVGTAMSRVLY